MLNHEKMNHPLNQRMMKKQNKKKIKMVIPMMNLKILEKMKED